MTSKSDRPYSTYTGCFCILFIYNKLLDRTSHGGQIACHEYNWGEGAIITRHKPEKQNKVEPCNILVTCLPEEQDKVERHDS